MLFLLLVIVLSIPSVQTYVAKKVTTNLNETYGTDINIDKIGLNWKGEVDIRGVYIADHQKDTLISAQELQTNILSFRNLIVGDLGFGDIKMDNAKLHVTTYKGEKDDNLYIFSEKFNTGAPSENPFSLYSNDVTLTNTEVIVKDENLESPAIIRLTNLNIIAEDFKIDGSNVYAKIQEMNVIDSRGYRVRNLRSDFSYTLEEMKLENLLLETDHSTIKGDLFFSYGEGGLADFVNGVTIDANFEDAEFSTTDLNSFYKEFGPNQTIYIDGVLKGNLNDFTYSDGGLRVGDTYLSGDLTFKNLLKDDVDYYMHAKNHVLSTNYYELRRFMPRVLGDVLPEQLKSLGQFNFRGTTELTPFRLTSNSAISSEIGSLITDLTMGNIGDFENATYNGTANVSELNLGALTGTSSLKTITANLNFEGRGFTQNTVDTQIKGKIASLVFEGYKYQNITVSGNLKNPIFEGFLAIDDPNLEMNFTGLVDVSERFNRYDFEAEVEYAELNKLNLINRDSVSIFTGNIRMDMDGTTIDNAVGSITFKNTFYQNDRDDFFFEDFKITASTKNEIRTIKVNSSDIVDGAISGKFKIEDIPNLFRNGIGSIYANYQPIEVTTNQFIEYNFEINNKIVDLFVPQLQVGENTRIKGLVSSDESEFKLNFKSPELLLFKNYLGKVNIQVDNNNPLYNTYASIDSVYTGVYNVVDVSLINKTINDTLYLRSEFKGGKTKDDLFNLSLYHTINPNGKSVVGVKRSDITYKDKVWYLNENNNRLNKVTFDDNFSTVKVDSLVLSRMGEEVRMAGVLRDSTYKDIKVQFKDVNIGNITPEIDSLRLEGNVNGRFDFLQKNGAYYPNSTVTVDNVSINDIEFGDLDLSVEGNENLTQYNINTTLTNDNVKSINAIGEIDVSANNPRIKLDVSLNDFDMRAFSPFGGDVVTNIRGMASGNVRVSGNYKAPDILGRIGLQGGGVKVPYLNTDFDIDDTAVVTVNSNSLELSETEITDSKYKTKGTLTAKALHTNFGDWILDMHIDAPDRLLVLDTPPDDDELYYGTAFISGYADIEGPADELVIDVVATTEEGTTFKIPISDTESIGDDSFINFLSPEEKQARISGETVIPVQAKGLSLNFDLDINDKAEVEVVVDKVNNSALKGRGAGTLLIRINTLGKFNMWGEFTVIQGTYDFRYGGLIQRKIAVVPGGNINWDGNPERARLNLSAKYETEANPSIILDNPTVNRKIPVNVLVDLTGELIQPNLDFRIEFPRTSSIVRSELEYKLQNEEERQKQALFLVASNSFVDDDYGGANALAASSLVVDRVSNIVNELFAGQDSKFRVGLDYSQGTRTPNQQTADRFGISLSTQINERILINGKVGVPVGGVNDTAVAGDIEVQWLINEDGSLRMNFFNRQADIQFIGEDQIFEQGAGISYSVDFDTFKELFQKVFKKKITLESDELPVTPDDDTLPVDFNSKGKQEEE